MELKHVFKSFDGKEVLSDVSLIFRRGKSVACSVPPAGEDDSSPAVGGAGATGQRDC